MTVLLAMLIIILAGVLAVLITMITIYIISSRCRSWEIGIVFLVHGIKDRTRIEAEILRLIASMDKRDRPSVSYFEPTGSIYRIPERYRVGSGKEKLCSLDSGKTYPNSEISYLSLSKGRPPAERLEALDYARRIEEFIVKGFGGKAERVLGGLFVSGS